jgi:hypothetical protein
MWNARSKLFIVSFFVVPCYDEVQGHWQKSRNLRNALMNENINIWNIRKRIQTGHIQIIGYQFGAKFKRVCCAKYDRGLDFRFWEILKPLKWTNITSFFLIKTWLKRYPVKNYLPVNLNKILRLFIKKNNYTKCLPVLQSRLVLSNNVQKNIYTVNLHC